MKRIPSDKIKNILVIRPDALGDVVLTLPAIHLLRSNFPNAKITVLAQEYTSPLLENNPDIDNIIYDYNLAKYQFDLSINFFNELRDTLATFQAGIPYRIGDNSRILTGWMNNYKVWIKASNLTKHRVERNLDMLAPLEIDPDDTFKDFLLNLSDKQKNFLNDFKKEQKLKDNDLIIGIHPGIGKTSRAWLPERYAKVAAYLIKELKAKVIMTGTKNERPVAKVIVNQVNSKHLIDLVGNTNLSQLVSIMSRYNVFIGVDTGPLHLAAALKIPTVALFPSKFLKPSEWGPWGTRHLILRMANKCSEKCFPKNCSLDSCLKAITANDVINGVKSLLAGEGANSLRESRDFWLKKSANILTNNSHLQQILLEAGYHVIKPEKNQSLFNLINLFIKNDINIIHWIGKFSPTVFIAKVFATPSLAIPPLLIQEKESTLLKARDLINFYKDKFQNS